MKTLFYFILLGVFASCKTHTALKGLHGTYLAKGKDYYYSLILNPDNTFLLKIKYQDAVPECSGNWRYFTKDTLELTCSALNDIAKSLTNGYMTERNHKVGVINKNKLKLDNVVLRKTNQTLSR
jgi:hypothetical protein